MSPDPSMIPALLRLRSRAAGLAATALLAACTSPAGTGQAVPGGQTVAIKIIAFNDFHGNLLPPRVAIQAPVPASASASGLGSPSTLVPAGGAAYLGSAIQSLKARNPHHAVVSAGDMIGGSPLVSALFLDEPTIEIFNTIQIDFNAVGNHEFDKGSNELLRMQHGGCAKFTLRDPCLVNKTFSGARFGFLAANVAREDGHTLFPATGMREFRGPGYAVKVAFIGMTLRNTPGVVAPDGVAGLRFDDEAETANKLVPQLKAQGADAIVVVLHEGGITTGGNNDTSCPSLTGDIVPILDRLDPRIDVVVSGHTHRAYICDYGRLNPARPFLLTSAGQYGTLLTDIDIVVDAAQKKVVAKSARNLIVQGEGFINTAGRSVDVTPLHPAFGKDPAVERIVATYAAAAAPLAQRPVGRVPASITRARAPSLESPLGNLIADAQLAATRAPQHGGAQLAFMNAGGVRADLGVPAGGGPLTYGQIFSVHPFGNSLVVKSLSGEQIRQLLEQQFTNAASPQLLFPSSGFSYTYDLTQPAGSRVTHIRLNGEALRGSTPYRVTMNSFLASGGDGFGAFTQGTDSLGGVLDVDALEQYLAAHPDTVAPPTNRVTRR